MLLITLMQCDLGVFRCEGQREGKAISSRPNPYTFESILLRVLGCWRWPIIVQPWIGGMEGWHLSRNRRAGPLAISTAGEWCCPSLPRRAGWLPAFFGTGPLKRPAEVTDVFSAHVKHMRPELVHSHITGNWMSVSQRQWYSLATNYPVRTALFLQHLPIWPRVPEYTGSIILDKVVYLSR